MFSGTTSDKLNYAALKIFFDRALKNPAFTPGKKGEIL